LAQIFKPWFNHLAKIVLPAVGACACGIVFFFWYYGSPKYTDVGYRPEQPVPYSHRLHAGDLGMDCRFCHSAFHISAHATVPPTQTCMNCHKLILPESSKLWPVRESWTIHRPIFWKRVHKTPDYAYFDHSAHIQVGVGCIVCHGDVAKMEVVSQQQPLSMSWCLDCHRHPDPYLRPRQEVTSMVWTPPLNQMEWAAQIRQEKGIHPPVDCSGCHR